MIPDKWQQYFADSKTQREEANLTRKLRPIRHIGDMRIQLGSKELVNFASNDYLGLAHDLRIAEAAARAAGHFGWGAGASRLVTGTTTLHHRLELETARFRGTDACIVFGSGYQANLGVIAGLASEGDTIFSDALNHSSILAACRLTSAKVKVFKHRDYDDLERKLNGTGNIKGKRIIVTDSMFSITGVLADLPRIAKLCERFDALMIIDDAHANAAIGKHGRGVAEEQQVLKSVGVTVGTYSKALGSYGGFVACDDTIRNHLINNAKPFIYTTSLPLPLVAANTEALKIVAKEGNTLRKKLKQNHKLLRSRLLSAEFEVTGDHHVLSVPFDGPERALHVATECETQGVKAYPMRYPSVPKGQDAIRISVSAAHTDDDIYKLVHVLQIARDRMVGKDTSGVNRRIAKRPTHATLGAHAEPEGLDGGMMGMDDMLDNQMSAADSSRLPPSDQVSDFQTPDLHDAGMTIIEQPTLAPFTSNESIKLKTDSDAGKKTENETGNEQTRKIEAVAEAKTSDESPDETDIEPESKSEDKKETAPVKVSDEKLTMTLPTDDEPVVSGSGETLAPEPIELKDPVIDKIEGKTKKRKNKKNKTKAKTRARKK
ncbi:8-amino-7-oxononanoate synthase [Planctomycetota bacterium]|nr:8-amino-7-oxononanoate synthase [Planctomycetota bacterium]